MPQRHRNHTANQGFTLVELSIVLVIIGLLIGAILVGKDLIRAAELRAAVSQLQKYQAAVNTFKLKFNATPGDLTTSQATELGMFPTTRANEASVHGNGILDTASCNYSNCGEWLLFWQDLSSAQLIAGSINAAPDDGNIGFAINPNRLMPTLTIGSNMFWTIDGPNQAPLSSICGAQACYATVQIFQTAPGNWNSRSYAGLTGQDASSIDIKIDDGSASSGRVQDFRSVYGHANDVCFSGTTMYPRSSNNMSCGLYFAF
jgi:prepilin-type N-terminal cleavage/methylation domain-containing protein